MKIHGDCTVDYKTVKMKIKGYLILIIILLPFYAFASESTEQRMDQMFGDHKQYKDFFFNLKENILEKQKEEVANLISFPISVSDGESKFAIKNKKEFLLYYDSIFDQGMLETIEQQIFDNLFVNWRGVMIGNGKIWYTGICEDDDCQKVIVKIKSFYNPNFFNSEIVVNANKEILKKERSKLHESLQTFIEPILQWKTVKYIIRVDRIDGDNYRYAAWPSDGDQSKKPNIILNNGVKNKDGNGGNHYYEFKNGAYRYRCYITVIGTANDPPGFIKVFKNDESLLYQPVIQVLK